MTEAQAKDALIEALREIERWKEDARLRAINCENKDREIERLQNLSVCEACGEFSNIAAYITQCETQIAELEAENAKLKQKLEWDVAEAMALVLNHEGYIERLRNALDRLIKAIVEHDNPEDAGLSQNHEAVISAIKLLASRQAEGEYLTKRVSDSPFLRD